ncbi:MAG: hypothetical protein ACRC8S_09350 [Fimbriiglobus sp.]
MIHTKSLVAVSLILMLGFTNSRGDDKPGLSEAEVNAAQKAWCEGLVQISKVHKDGGDYKATAAKFIDETYDYKEGKVFFKPTLAFGKNTFRSTRDGALAYFVGGSQEFPEDSGFALKDWVKVDFDDEAEENGIQIHGNIAIMMGHLTLTNGKGEKTKVEKTFVFRKDKAGKIRLCAHKSALPFEPKK